MSTRFPEWPQSGKAAKQGKQSVLGLSGEPVRSGCLHFPLLSVLTDINSHTYLSTQPSVLPSIHPIHPSIHQVICCDVVFQHGAAMPSCICSVPRLRKLRTNVMVPLECILLTIICFAFQGNFNSISCVMKTQGSIRGII